MTPRTDAVVETAWCGCFSSFVDADFARELERELAAARAELERAMKVVEAAMLFVSSGHKADEIVLGIECEQWEAGR